MRQQTIGEWRTAMDDYSYRRICLKILNLRLMRLLEKDEYTKVMGRLIERFGKEKSDGEKQGVRRMEEHQKKAE